MKKWKRRIKSGHSRTSKNPIMDAFPHAIFKKLVNQTNIPYKV